MKMGSGVNDEIDDDNLKEVVKGFGDGIEEGGKVELNEKRMYDVMEGGREGVEKNERVDVDKVEWFGNERKDMVGSKGGGWYFKEGWKGYIDGGGESSVYIVNGIIGGE